MSKEEGSKSILAMSSSAFAPFLSQQACDTATSQIAATVTVATASPTTHDVALVSGLENGSIRDALAIYLLNCAAQTLSTNLSILSDLLGESEDDATTFRAEVNRLIGEDNAVSEDFRQDHRDPWMGEGLAHLLVKIASSLPPLPPPGCLHALTPVHDDVKEHGLDLVGIYTCTATGVLGLAISESKASESNATAHVASAAELFLDVMNGGRDPHIRSKVQALRHALPPAVQALIPKSGVFAGLKDCK